MSSFQLIRSALLGAGSQRTVISFRPKIGDNLAVAKWSAIEDFHQFRSLYRGQPSEQSASTPQEDINMSKPREILIDKIKKSQKRFQIVSLPNIITTSRAMMAPAMGYFIMNNMHSYAIVCCAYAALSDVADKLIASLTKQSSPLNFALDAIADKLFIATSCIALYNLDIMSIYMLKSVMLRDLLIVGGAAILRYHGFEERPTLKQYLDVNHYPSLFLKTNLLHQVITGLQYSVIMAFLGLNHLVGDPFYDWSIYIYQGFIIGLSSFSLASCVILLNRPRFLSPPPRQR